MRLALDAIPPFDHAAADAAQARQNRLTKPTGSLARLEDLSVQLAGMTGQAFPSAENAVIFIYAADHGVAAAHGVSAYPPAVTAQMVYNFARGGAVINALASEISAKLIVADVGVMEEIPGDLNIAHHKVRPGTDDWTIGPAMTEADAITAITVGQHLVRECSPLGLALVGEMGIGNTTTAAVLAAVLLGVPPSEIVGPGTGVDGEALARKHAVVALGMARHGTNKDPLALLASLGGLEIAAMTGTILAAAARRVPVVLDGFISTVAGAIAVQFDPAARDYLIASHRSPEPGHRLLLAHLGLTPLLDLGLRLGEASGAALAVPLLRASVRILREVATFGEAGVSDKGGG